MRFALALTLTLALEGAAGAAVFTEENGYCSNAANAFKTADMTLSSCEQLCETTPGCFDGYFCGSANCGGVGAGMVCSSTSLFAFFFAPNSLVPQNQPRGFHPKRGKCPSSRGA